jgi:type IV secretory pathway ATPase VirB11/archaellum biosynthesis ATPase
MLGPFARGDAGCDCEPAFDGDRLTVDAEDCPGGGRLATAPACRATVVGALADRDAERVLTRADGRARAYEDGAAALLVAAGRFVDAAGFHDEALAERARRDPLGAAEAATARAGPVARVAAETGLAEGARRADGYEAALRPYTSPMIAQSRVAARLPPGARLADRRELDTGAVVRVYDRPGEELRRYHLEPVESELDPADTRTLAAAYRRLAEGSVGGGERAPGRAVRAVAGDDAPVGRLADVLRKHARGLGVLEDLFADPACSDAFVTAPAGERPLRIRVDDEPMGTNVRLTRRGVEALASRFRRTSGRSFSRADPTLDATVDVAGRRVRVAGVTEPASDGVAFAFRAHERDAWTLPALVVGNTLSTTAAGLLSVAVERGAACLIAGARGVGKTTTLGALCFELPAATRTVVIEDTPELPVEALRTAGRDVQAVRASEAFGHDEALRTALRLGEGALVVGEVRGAEAATLFEAMRVGATDGAVLGTVHGEGAAAVRERVVADCDVAPAAFGATDLVCALETTPDGRRLTRVEEVLSTDDGVEFAPLFESGPTGRLDRGNSRLVAALARPGETYADVRAAVDARADWLDGLAAAGRTAPGRVAAAHAERRASA